VWRLARKSKVEFRLTVHFREFGKNRVFVIKKGLERKVQTFTTKKRLVFFVKMLELANDIFLLEQAYAAPSSSSSSASTSELMKKVVGKLTVDNMSVLYQHLANKFSFAIDEDLLNTMK
jgi:hypothetical protein